MLQWSAFTVNIKPTAPYISSPSCCEPSEAKQGPGSPFSVFCSGQPGHRTQSSPWKPDNDQWGLHRDRCERVWRLGEIQSVWDCSETFHFVQECVCVWRIYNCNSQSHQREKNLPATVLISADIFSGWCLDRRSWSLVEVKASWLNLRRLLMPLSS